MFYLYVHEYTHMHIYVSMYIHTYTYMYIYTSIRTQTVYIYTCTYTDCHTYIYMYIYIPTYTHTHIYKCMYICIHIYTHTHSYVYLWRDVQDWGDELVLCYQLPAIQAFQYLQRDWLIQMCDITYLGVWHDSCIRVSSSSAINFPVYRHSSIYWGICLVDMCDMIHKAYASFTCVTRLIHQSNMTHL